MEGIVAWVEAHPVISIILGFLLFGGGFDFSKLLEVFKPKDPNPPSPPSPLPPGPTTVTPTPAPDHAPLIDGINKLVTTVNQLVPAITTIVALFAKSGLKVSLEDRSDAA